MTDTASTGTKPRQRSTHRIGYPVVSAVNRTFAIVVLLGTLLIDMLYPYLDPRIRYE